MHIPKWAQGITAEKRDNVIVVVGEGHYPFPGFSVARRADSNSRRWMHIELANAETERELLAFVAKHGPVNGRTLGGELYPVAISPRGFKSVTVEQPMAKLRDAQQAIATAARLIAVLQSGGLPSFETVNRLCCKLAEYVDQPPENPTDLEPGKWSKRTVNLATRREMSVAADFLRPLLDKFPPKLARLGRRHAVELPFYDEAGVLPILYWLLRQDFLSDVRTIGICERCRRLFVVRRRGAQFCSAECSQLKRALDYYHSKHKLRGKGGK
jgi:hypothetical protein